MVYGGRSVALSEGSIEDHDSEVVNADGKRVALVTGSALLLPGRSASLVDVPVD